MIYILLTLLLIFSFVLIKSADLVVISLRHLSKGTGTSVFFLSAILVALGTSLPEFSVGITSSLSGSSHISLGNILGANIANISLIAGLTGLIAGGISIKSNNVKREVMLAFLAGISPMILLIDGMLSRTDGIILIAVYVAYTLSFIKIHAQRLGSDHKRGFFLHRFIREFEHFETTKSKEIVRFITGIILLLVSAGFIVEIAKKIAVIVNLPVFLIGLILISLGTTLPELAFSLSAMRKHEPNMFFGSLLGSIIGNSTLIIGVASVISPIKTNPNGENLIASGAFVIVFLLFWFFIRLKERLERWEAGVLFVIYLVFVLFELGINL